MHTHTHIHTYTLGGAWIIGYKLWCALIGRTLSSMGVLTIVPDYRNFPQGDIEDMISDVKAAVKWSSNNVIKYGGDPEKIVLAGQSAGTDVEKYNDYFFRCKNFILIYYTVLYYNII